MTFAALLAGEATFLDANTLVYHFVSDPLYGAACSQVLQRIENQEIAGLTSTHVLTEVAHRTMTIEAISAFTWPVAGIARRLRQHPAQVQQLACSTSQSVPLLPALLVMDATSGVCSLPCNPRKNVTGFSRKESFSAS
jgi:predicted nucleic acid-binding protein